MFIVLYPPGILSEAWLCYKIIEPSKSRNPMYQYLLWTGITFYVPGMSSTLPDKQDMLYIKH